MRDDWISPWWQAACLPASWDVCGVKCPPLTVWHTFALENIGNSYLVGGPVGKDAASSLLLFAKHDRAGGRKLILMPRFREREMQRMYRRLKDQDADMVHAACTEYVASCMRGASRWQKCGWKPYAVPYQWHIVARLGDAAWDMPYAEARCRCDALAEASGDDSIMSVRAQEMEDNWADYEKAAAN